MIKEFRDDDLIHKFGGRFKLAALIQKRWLQLLQGERPMVESKNLAEMEIVIKEIVDGKLEMVLPDREEVVEQDERADDLGI